MTDAIFKEFVDKVKSFEGFRSVAYDDLQPNKPIKTPADIKGTLTIGYGRTSDVKIGDITTKENEDLWIRSRLFSEYNIVNNLLLSYGYDVSESFILGLTDFSFNCGKSNLMKLIDNGKRTPEEIKKYIVLYNKSKGSVLQGLVRRRQFELNLLNSNETKPRPTKEMVFETQAFLNHLVKEYNLPFDKIVTDGIFGIKTETLFKNILDCFYDV